MGLGVNKFGPITWKTLRSFGPIGLIESKWAGVLSPVQKLLFINQVEGLHPKGKVSGAKKLIIFKTKREDTKFTNIRLFKVF